MSQAPCIRCTFRFYEELNAFLPPERRMRDFLHEIDRRASIKDVIEALGVPHTEVDLILMNGESVGFDHIPEDGDRISVYPVFERLDIAPLNRLRPRPLRDPAFVVDVNLGRLARYLRLLGFDAWYRNDYEDAAIADIAVETGRIVLTRDRNLLKYSRITHGCFVHHTDPEAQAREVLERLDLYRLIRPFHRCTRCNGLIRSVGKGEIAHRLPPLTRRYYEEFWECTGCGQLYWKGAHQEPMQALVARLSQAKPCRMDANNPRFLCW